MSGACHSPVTVTSPSNITSLPGMKDQHGGFINNLNCIWHIQGSEGEVNRQNCSMCRVGALNSIIASAPLNLFNHASDFGITTLKFSLG